MAAGLGFKTFQTGEVLTAADTNGYLMQGVLVFANAAARDAAITSPEEGQCCYLKDTDAVLTYSGTAWVGFDDSNAIQNAIVDAKGDLISATANDTPARLGVGANDTILTADSSTSTGLKWAAPAASGLNLINSTTFSGATSVAVDSVFSATYDNYFIQTNFTSSGSTDQNLSMRLRVGGADATGNDYLLDGFRAYPSAVAYVGATATSWFLHNISSVNAENAHHTIQLLNPFGAANTKITSFGFGYTSVTFGTNSIHQSGRHGLNTSYDGFKLYVSSGNIAGTVKIYGYKN
jgi:hypothetical protein